MAQGLNNGSIEQTCTIKMRRQALRPGQRCGSLDILMWHHLSTQCVFQGKQAGASIMNVIGLDARFNICQSKRSIWLMCNRLGLDTAKHSAASCL